jgi:hypothetical protein
VAEPPRTDVAPPAVGPESVDPRPTADVLRSLAENSQALVRKELELAKLEVTEILVARAIALGAALVGAIISLFVLGFAGVTGAKALELVLPAWAAWLIVTGVYALITITALLIAMRKATNPPNVPERTKAEAEQTVEWLKGQVQR